MFAKTFEEFFTVNDFPNHITFFLHNSGSSFDPVFTNLPERDVACRLFGAVGSSDLKAHFMLLR